ncbi:MAG: ferrous iron transporter B [Bdellovibrionales bacterium]|nr:ferrous iron transporter B [Bdellovibrionales bacterium]
MSSDSNTNKKHIILIGPPNSGKTTLFNWLTGYKARVVNYPGSTVDYLTGDPLDKYNLPYKIIDTPGVYSIFPKNPSEHITQKILTETPVHTVLVSIDISRLHRQLPLVFQLKAMGLPVAVALTMTDLVDQKYDISKLSKTLGGIPVFSVQGKLGQGVTELAQGISKLSHKPGTRMSVEDISKLQSKFFEQTDEIIEKLLPKEIKGIEFTKKADRILLHPIFGTVSFISIMMILFSSIFWLAAPLMDLVDMGFSVIAEKTLQLGDSLFIDFLSNGVITSFAAVSVFIPQIFILFAGISILEDSGYLARAVSLMDTFFSKIGLSGRSFIPFLSGYACAIPACLSARNLTSRTERWIVIAVIPLLTCSARLPVYSLLLSLFFYDDSPWKAGLWMTIIYCGSMVLASIGAYILSLVIRSNSSNPFVMELPIYRRPLLFGVVLAAWRRSFSYIKGAGPLIFIFALLMWGALNFPRNADWSPSEQMENSYAGQFGKAIEPAFEQMGTDWRVGIGLISAFVAREVFVSTLATLFQITGDAEESSLQHSLLKKMRLAQNKRGDPVFTPLSLGVLILFFMISLQCLSTTAVVQRETNSTLFAVTQLFLLNFLAYFISVGIYQILS